MKRSKRILDELKDINDTGKLKFREYKTYIRIIFFFWKIWKLFFNGIKYYMYIEIEKLNYTIFFQLKIIFDEQSDIGNGEIVM